MTGRGIGAERIHRHQRRDAADLRREVPAADADGLRYTAAVPGYQARNFLYPGARGADDPDIAARHHVGESQGHTADDARTAIGTHDQ